jgi:hypothetical protein
MRIGFETNLLLMSGQKAAREKYSKFMIDHQLLGSSSGE